jgi:hypothetical protein
MIFFFATEFRPAEGVWRNELKEENATSDESGDRGCTS